MNVSVPKIRVSALWRVLAAVCLLGITLLIASVTTAPASPGDDISVEPVPTDERSGGDDAVAGAGRRLLVRFEAGVDPADRAAIKDSVEAEFLRSYSLVPRLQLLKLPTGADRDETIATLESEPGVAYAEPDLIRQIEVTSPNDTFYRSPNFYLWGLNNTGQSFTVGSTGYTGTPDADIDAPEAWDLTRGSSSVTVAVIDSGMQLNHPDLAANLWTNPNETPGNGIDDDANGRIDDVNGWDFVNSDNDPTDDDGHGTHVAGTIGAAGNNNSGVTGVAWNVKLMPLKACNAAGSCAISATIAALNYAVAQGVKISNNSYGGISSQSTSERNAITAARDAGHLFVAAAGNDGVNTDVPANAHYPSNYNLDNIISVASTTLNDGLSSFSNYGTTSVDLGAPGSQILSTYTTSSYVWANGTSMASPHVAGVAALVKSRKPDWSYSQVRSRLIDNTRPLASLSGTTVTGGMLNAYSALLFAPDPPTIGSGPSGFVSSTSASFSFTGETVGAGVTFECRIDSGSWGSCSSPKSYASLSQGSHTFEVRQTDQAGNASTAASRTWTVDTLSPSAPSITSGPSGFVSSNSASLAFTGEASATFECRIDSGSWGSCSSPKSYASLSQGSHTYEVRQTDQAGNASTAASRTWTVDTVAPSAPTIDSGPSGFVSSTSASLSFTGEASATFECRIDSGSWGSCSSPKSYSGLSQGSHTFEVRQTDQAGNVSTEASRTWTVDTGAPSAPTIDSGPSGFVSSTSASLSFTGEASATFECRIDSGSWSSCVSPKSYASLSLGSHTFEVRQTDQAGNVSTEASRTWTVDTFTLSAPSITQGPEGEVNSTEASFEFSGVSGATFECRLDDGPFETCSSPFEVADLDAGPHEFAVKQTDSIGNVSEAATRSWTVLEVATVQPQLAGTNETGEVVFEGAPDGFTYLCAVGSEELHPCGSPYIPTGLTDGSYPIQIVIEDPEGNLSASTETELVIEGTPQPPEGEPSIIVNGGAVYGRTVEVELGIIWPTGARRAVISNASEPPGQSSVLSPSIPWTLATGQGARTVTVEFIGAGDVPLGTVSDSIFLDPNRPSLKSAKVRKNRGKVWWTAVKAVDSGSGLSKLAWSTRRSRPGTNAVPAKIVNFTRPSTVKTRLPSRPRWAKVQDRAGNWSGWRAIKPR